MCERVELRVLVNDNRQESAILRLKQLEDSADHHHELTALTDALTASIILGERNWAE